MMMYYAGMALLSLPTNDVDFTSNFQWLARVLRAGYKVNTIKHNDVMCYVLCDSHVDEALKRERKRQYILRRSAAA
eukprot:scaffold5056_cov119-Skeletonema_dohrnii-CCMP3373.AAC.1